MRRNILLIIAVLFVASCHQSSIVKDAHVILAHPLNTLSLDCDSTFNFQFSEVQDCQWIQVVSDSVIVLEDMIF